RARSGRSARGRIDRDVRAPFTYTLAEGSARANASSPGMDTYGAPGHTSGHPMASPPSRGVIGSLLHTLDRPAAPAILPHDNRDPDSRASAAALKFIAGSLLEKPAEIALGGIVGRAENRAMRTYLNIDLKPVSEVRFDGGTQIALVDTQPGRPNNSLPAGIVPHVVIDHHPAYASHPRVPLR